MDNTPNFIQKLGTLDADIVEANPVVWKGRLLIFEYIRYMGESLYYHGNHTGKSYFRFLDVEKNTCIPAFGTGLHMGNAYVAGDKMVVTAVENWGKSRFYQLESTDLIHWSEPRIILENPAYQGFNTSMTRTDDRYILVFELGAPAEKVGVPYTMFFAESTDLVHWKEIDGAVFGFDHYTGGPMIRWFDGIFYLTFLNICSENSFETYIVRSRDLKNWEWSKKNPVLGYGESDRKILPAYPAELITKAKNAVNINASDVDICNCKGNLEIVYSWGDQRGTEFLSRAFVPNMTEKEFCEYFF